jgi:DNA-binding Lrp family transcriptional regulator
MTGIKIDEINANILRELLIDARTSFTEISKKNHISVVAVTNRYEKLVQTGVIGDAIMQINPYAVGLNCNGFLEFEVEEENVKEIRDFLEKKPYILSTWTRERKKNIGAFFATPNMQYFNEIKNQLNRHPDIIEMQHLIFVGFITSDFPDNLIIKTNIIIKEEPKEINDVQLNTGKDFIQTSELRQMDKTDRAISRMISEDARSSFRNIAKKLEISTSTVIRRYNKLRTNNLLIRSTISVDLKKLGYKARVLVYFNIKSGADIFELQKTLLKITNLIVLDKTLGKTDMLAVLPISTVEDFLRLKAKFNKNKQIKGVQFDIVPIVGKWPHNYFAKII